MKWRVNGFYLSHDGDDFAATVSTMGPDKWLAFTGTGEDIVKAPGYFDSAQQAMRWCEDRLAGDGRGGSTTTTTAPTIHRTSDGAVGRGTGCGSHEGQNASLDQTQRQDLAG